MHFYKKIFIVFLGLMAITPRFAGAAEEPICSEGKYIATCDFNIPHPETGLLATWPGADITPETVFGFLAWYTYAFSGLVQTGYLCWDFDDPKKNWDNLRKLFNPQPSDGPMTCYKMNIGDPQQIWYIIQSNTKPAALTVEIPRETEGGITGYSVSSEILKIACQKNSVTSHNSWCQPCPDKGLSKGAKYDHDSTKWTAFSTIADCYNFDNKTNNTYTDITGTYTYQGGGTCYYSGE